MYVSRDQARAVVFAFSINSDHWNNLAPRLTLRGLIPDAEYDITEPYPNDITQQAGNFMLIESDGKSFYSFIIDIHFHSISLIYNYQYLVPIYQLGRSDVVLTGETLMNAGLPGKKRTFHIYVFLM
jgi:hypothetical protein